MAWLMADTGCHSEKETLGPCPHSQIPLRSKGTPVSKSLCCALPALRGIPSHLVPILALCSSMGLCAYLPTVPLPH